MAKAFSLIGLFVALVLLALFAADMALGNPEQGTGFPFMGFNKAMDVGFIIASAILAYLSFTTYRELP